ncbi:MAG: hypothetical protein HRT81_11045 [Henriciella sp.]|nr:hypothetical protein [Henriciella sp.]
MYDETPGAANTLDEQDIVALTKRPSDAYNEVILQADYTTRAALSFYRFRQLGGDYHLPRKKKQKASNSPQGGETEASPRHEKLKLNQTTGRGVHYISSHPKVPMLQMSIIALMIIFESAANAYFFAKQSEFGLAGGIFQAAAVSLANVATAFFIVGYWGMRHISMPIDWENIFSRRNLYVLMGLIAIIIGLSLVFLVNLSAAHYRNILDMQALGQSLPEGLPTTVFPHFIVNPAVCEEILKSPLGDTIGSAATNAMCRPFALHSLDAMVLFALGLAIAAFAAFEGRRRDSPFPGFSDAARGLERARVELRDALYDFEDSYEDIKEVVLEVKYGEDEMEDKKLSPREKMIIHRTMAEMMAPYQELLRTTDDGLSDEFGLEHKIIDQFKAKTGQ